MKTLHDHINKEIDFKYVNGLYIYLEGDLYEIDGEKTLSFSLEQNLYKIVKLFREKKEKSFDLFEGSFFIAILDPLNDVLYLSIDRIGMKNIYYYFDGHKFIFSKNLENIFKNYHISKVIDKDSLALYIRYGYISEPYTIFKGVRKLQSGNYIKFDLKNNTLKEIPYWNMVDIYFRSKEKIDLSEKEIIDQIDTLLKRSIEKRIKNKDEIYGSFLSGGYDSAIVTLFLQNYLNTKVETFTLGFYEEGYNEADDAKKIAYFLNTSHNELYFSSKKAKEVFPKIAEIYPEPFSDKAALGMLFLSEFAASKVKNIFSGEGGDEVFGLGGDYPDFEKLNLIPLFMRKSMASFMNKFSLSMLDRMGFIYNFSTRFLKWRDIFFGEDIADFLKYREQVLNFDEIREIFREPISTLPLYENKRFDLIEDEFSKMLAVYFEIYMKNDEIVKISKIADFMKLRLFEPILDRKLMEFLAKVDFSLKRKEGIYKYLAKALCERYIPKSLMQRPKKGLSIPLHLWMRGDLREYLEYYLDENRIKKEGFFNPQKILFYKKEFLNGKNEYTKRVWILLLFELWYEKNFKGN